MEREGDRAKKGSEVRRSFVIDVEEGKRVRERFEEGDDRGEGGDVGGGRAVFERGEVDIPEVNGHEYVLVPVHRFDGKTSRQVGRRPFAPVGSEGEAFEGGVIRVGEAWIRGGGRGEGSVGGNREAGRGGGPACRCDTLSQGVEVPVCCGKGERGKLADKGVG